MSPGVFFVLRGPSPIDGFGKTYPDDIKNLAGQYPAASADACYGTGFDLEVIAQDPLVESGVVDLDQILYVKVIDVIGDGTTYDTHTHSVYDPFPTAFASGGFDLQAIDVIHQ